MKTRLAHSPERLDDAVHDERTLRHSLAHVAQVNRLLGGERAALSAVSHLLTADADVAILDIGTGGADIPVAIAAAARRAGARVRITAVDIHPQMRAIAAARTADWPEIDVGSADALDLPYAAASFDAALLTLTLHHFEDDDPVRVLREAARVSRLVVVNELERGWANYTGARLLSWTWWRSNPLTRHDGPLSVLRAFTANELRDIAHEAGLTDVRVSRGWFFRLLLTGAGRA